MLSSENKFATYLLLAWLLLQVSLFTYLSNILYDNIRVGTYHPIFIFWLAVSMIFLAFAMIFQARGSRSCRWLVLTSAFFGLAAFLVWKSDVAIVLAVPTLGAAASVFLMYKPKLSVAANIAVLLVVMSGLYPSISLEREAIDHVRNGLSDPDSAIFRNTRNVQWYLAGFVCGEVNSKNRFGGYTGFEKYTYVDGKVLMLPPVEDQNADSRRSNLTFACLVDIFKNSNVEPPPSLKWTLK